MTGGYLKSSVHRVHAPPDDQAHVDRLGVLYFARYVSTHSMSEERSWGLHLLTSSGPEASGIGEQRLHQAGPAPEHGEWVKVRQSQQQRRTKAPKIDGQKYEYGDKELEIIPGLQAKIYA
ncbi:hypothetical protein LTR53_016776 [Teratosphaeriaceae sp. CCFEE 6253]|nr:hypothetical protein LTR53_016776 [Teratosphaeriaceae sp. CCFEE 6253]